MKTIIFLLALMSMNAFALTPDEEKAYKALIAKKTQGQKIAAASANLGSMLFSCPVGAALTVLAGAADTLPLGTAAVDVATDAEIYGGDNTTCSAILGGAISGVVDLIKGVGNLARASDEKNFTNLKATYKSTALTAKAAFGKSGYCADQYDRLGIILGLK